MEYIGLFVCASMGLILLLLVVLWVLLVRMRPPAIAPTDYGWVLLKDTEEGVTAYHRDEFVLNYIPEMGVWEMYNCAETKEPKEPRLWVVGELTDQFMEDLDSHIQRYSHD